MMTVAGDISTGSPVSRRGWTTDRVVLLVLLCWQFLLVLLLPGRPAPIGDEWGVIAKVQHLAGTGRLPQARPEELDIASGSVTGDSDFRPPGYPVFVWISSLGDDRWPVIQWRVTIVQFWIVALALWLVQGIILRLCTSRLTRLLMSVVIGIQPWAFEFVHSTRPDTLTMGLATFGLAILAFYDGSSRRSMLALCFGTLILCSTLLVRPEMFAIAPVIVTFSVLATRPPLHRLITHGLIASIVFFSLAAIQVTYRTWFVGKPGVYGPERLKYMGAWNWVNTWFSTEETLELVWNFRTGASGCEFLPSSAFSDETERARILAAFRMREQSAAAASEADRVFAQVAAERVRESPIRHWVLPRIWRTTIHWVNLETSPQLLRALAEWPRPPRRIFLGCLFALRILVVGFGFFGAVLLLRRRRASLVGRAAALFGFFVIVRAVFFGPIIGAVAHRYAVSGWPPLLLTCAAGLDWFVMKAAPLRSWRPIEGLTQSHQTASDHPNGV